MAKYKVKLLKTVHDLLEAIVEVEAESEDEAQEAALALANEIDSTVEFNFYDTLGDGGIEVSSIKQEN